jgi:hypothetical protein
VGNAATDLEVYIFVQNDERTLAGAQSVDGVSATVTGTTDNDEPAISLIHAVLPASGGSVNVDLTFQFNVIQGDIKLSVFRVTGKTSEVAVRATPDQNAVISNDFDVRDGDVLIGCFGELTGTMSYSGMTQVGGAFAYLTNDTMETATHDVTANDVAYNVTQFRTTGRIANIIAQLR